MSKSLKCVAVTGGAGQIAYNLLFRIANGDLFGPDQPVALHILEIPQAMNALKGVEMELEDCAFRLLQDIKIGSDPFKIFENVDWALLVGSKPRGPGMERGDLLTENGKIFTTQGQALNEVASSDVKVLVVGNPCNTNCLITMNHAPNIPRKNFHAMTRLDQNRAVNQLAKKGQTTVNLVSNMTIWGNHSSTQVPDYFNANIKGLSAQDAIKDDHWLSEEFIPIVQKRGAAIIEARAKSSAASAASAVIDAVSSLKTQTAAGHWFSSAVCTDGNPYGIEGNLIFSFPCRSDGEGNYEIVADLPWNQFLKECIRETEIELLAERDIVANLLKPKAVGRT